MKLVLNDFSVFMLVHIKITESTASAGAHEGMFLLREKTATASSGSNALSMEIKDFLPKEVTELLLEKICFSEFMGF